MAAPMLLDTDALSAIMRMNSMVAPRARAYLMKHGRFTFSVITHYETLRGLQAKSADKQVAAFGRFVARSTIVPIPRQWHR